MDPGPLLDALRGKTLIAHNARFDLSFLSRMGLEIGEYTKVIDTMLLSQMLRGQRPKDKEDR